MRTRFGTVTLALALAFPLSGVPGAHAVGPRDANERHSDPHGARGVARGAAAGKILERLTGTLVPCTVSPGATRQCLLIDVAVGANVHYGTIAESGDHVALVTVRWTPEPGVHETRALVFVSEPGRDFSFVDDSEIPGSDVFDVRFEPYRISYSATYLRPDDPPADPTGVRRYEIVHGAGRLKVRIREADVDLPPARPRDFATTQRRDRLIDAVVAGESGPPVRR